MIIVRRVCQVCCTRCCSCCCCCNLLQNAITKRYQQWPRLRLRQEQLHILQLGVITVRVTLGLMLMHSEQFAASAQLFSRFTCRAGGVKEDSSREGQGGGRVTVFIHVYRLQRIQFSCAVSPTTLWPKKAKQGETERESERETREREECSAERGSLYLQLLWQQT